MTTDPTPTPATGGIVTPDSPSNVLIDPTDIPGLVVPAPEPAPAVDGPADGTTHEPPSITIVREVRQALRAVTGETPPLRDLAGVIRRRLVPATRLDEAWRILRDIGDSMSPTGERPIEAYGSLTEDVADLVQRCDDAHEDRDAAREQVRVLTAERDDLRIDQAGKKDHIRVLAERLIDLESAIVKTRRERDGARQCNDNQAAALRRVQDLADRYDAVCAGGPLKSYRAAEIRAALAGPATPPAQDAQDGPADAAGASGHTPSSPTEHVAQELIDALKHGAVVTTERLIDVFGELLAETRGQAAQLAEVERARHELAQGWAERGMEIQRLTRELDEARRGLWEHRNWNGAIHTCVWPGCPRTLDGAAQMSGPGEPGWAWVLGHDLLCPTHAASGHMPQRHGNHVVCQCRWVSLDRETPSGIRSVWLWHVAQQGLATPGSDAVPPVHIAEHGCDDCSVEPGETHRYAGCPGNERAMQRALATAPGPDATRETAGPEDDTAEMFRRGWVTGYRRAEQDITHAPAGLDVDEIMRQVKAHAHYRSRAAIAIWVGNSDGASEHNADADAARAEIRRLLEAGTPQRTAPAGLWGKYYVERVDGRDQPGRDKADARYFVLDYVHDDDARVALAAYAAETDDARLAADLRAALEVTDEPAPQPQQPRVWHAGEQIAPDVHCVRGSTGRHWDWSAGRWYCPELNESVEESQLLATYGEVYEVIPDAR